MNDALVRAAINARSMHHTGQGMQRLRPQAPAHHHAGDGRCYACHEARAHREHGVHLTEDMELCPPGPECEICDEYGIEG